MTSTLGAVRHYFTVEQDTGGARTAAGGLSENWVTFATDVPGRYTGLDGREIRIGGQFQHGITGRVRMRYIDGVTAGMRLTFNGRALVIRSVVNEDERGLWLVMFVEERPTP